MTTKKPPPPSYRPTAGFASVTEAVRHFADQGKSPKEIAELTGSTTEAVRGLMQRHRQVRRTTAIDGLTWPQREKIRRTYLAYLDLMAEGLGSDRDTIHHLCRGVHVNKEPALPPEQKVDEAEPGEKAGLVDTPSPPKNEPEKPKVLISRLKPMAMEPMTGQCFLKNKVTGAYLHYSCTIMTMEKSQRWKGTPQQAAVCRDRFPVAKDLTLINVTP